MGRKNRLSASNPEMSYDDLVDVWLEKEDNCE